MEKWQEILNNFKMLGIKMQNTQLKANLLPNCQSCQIQNSIRKINKIYLMGWPFPWDVSKMRFIQNISDVNDSLKPPHLRQGKMRWVTSIEMSKQQK